MNHNCLQARRLAVGHIFQQEYLGTDSKNDCIDRRKDIENKVGVVCEKQKLKQKITLQENVDSTTNYSATNNFWLLKDEINDQIVVANDFGC